jgi:hypothetical protein
MKTAVTLHGGAVVMFVTKTYATAAAFLMVLACGASAAAPAVTDEDTKKTPEAAPLGVVHDFGKVERGTIPEHTFRIVNTSDVALEITSVRRWGGCAGGAISAEVSKRQLQPLEEAQLKVSLDTCRFKGRKTYRVVVEADNGKPMVSVFSVTADAQNPPQ